MVVDWTSRVLLAVSFCFPFPLPNIGQPLAAQKNDQRDLQTVEMYYNNISSFSIESIVQSYLSNTGLAD